MLSIRFIYLIRIYSKVLHVGCATFFPAASPFISLKNLINFESLALHKTLCTYPFQNLLFNIDIYISAMNHEYFVKTLLHMK